MQADSRILGSEDEELISLVHTVKNDILPDIKYQQLFGETGEGIFSRYSSEVKNYVIKLDEKSALTDMRKIYDIAIKRNKTHNKNMDQLKHLFLAEDLSIEEALIKFGGERMKDASKNDLDQLVSQLLESPEIMLPEKNKQILFKQWEEKLKKLT